MNASFQGPTSNGTERGRVIIRSLCEFFFGANIKISYRNIGKKKRKRNRK